MTWQTPLNTCCGQGSAWQAPLFNQVAHTVIRSRGTARAKTLVQVTVLARSSVAKVPQVRLMRLISKSLARGEVSKSLARGEVTPAVDVRQEYTIRDGAQQSIGTTAEPMLTRPAPTTLNAAQLGFRVLFAFWKALY